MGRKRIAAHVFFKLNLKSGTIGRYLKVDPQICWRVATSVKME